jgi:uncharacterized protein (DUF1697 family)
MKHVALLRGINVGTTKRIEMKKLKILFEETGYTNVSTYINSGNVIFESSKSSEILQNEIRLNLHNKFGFDIPALVKSSNELIKIAAKIPLSWVNDESQKTDVAYLFKEIDSEKFVDELPIKREFVDIRYTSGAFYWNVKREDYNKSHLNKLINHKFYQCMTVRNINTARYLAEK